MISLRPHFFYLLDYISLPVISKCGDREKKLNILSAFIVYLRYFPSEMTKDSHKSGVRVNLF